MEKNNKPQQPVPQKKQAQPGRNVRSGYLYALAAVIILAGLYYLLAELKVFSPKRRNLESVMAAYQLYNPADTKMKVALFFGDPDSDGFRPARAEIFASGQPINQVKQALILLCQGPAKDAGLDLLPEGTALREAYLDPNSILYVDMSQEFSANAKGGTTSEYQAVYSIINTVFYNFNWVKGVRILINGEEKETVAGHIVIRGVMTPDTDLSGFKI